jgi:hypothetical protein
MRFGTVLVSFPRPIEGPSGGHWGRLFLLWACGGPSFHEEGLEWNGAPLRVESRMAKPEPEALRALGLEALAGQSGTDGHFPERILRIAPGEWGDSLRLLDFGGELEAYAAFQELAWLPEDVAAGVTVHGDRVCFRRGKWIGMVEAWNWKDVEAFDRALALPGAPVAGGIPALFGSMVHQRRLPGSERILTTHFMGLKIASPVFSVRVDCQGDTAWVYASQGLRKSAATAFTAQLLRSPGWRVDTLSDGIQVSRTLSELPPAILWFSNRGMVGVEACFDEDLTKNWLKMQARGLKGLK